LYCSADVVDLCSPLRSTGGIFNSEIRAKASIASWFMGFLLGSLSATSAGDVSTVGGAPSVDLPDCEPLRHT
jgi:hypothetical protein